MVFEMTSWFFMLFEYKKTKLRSSCFFFLDFVLQYCLLNKMSPHYKKLSNFWSVLLGHFHDAKTSFSEEWIIGSLMQSNKYLTSSRAIEFDCFSTYALLYYAISYLTYWFVNRDNWSEKVRFKYCSIRGKCISK